MATTQRRWRWRKVASALGAFLAVAGAPHVLAAPLPATAEAARCTFGGLSEFESCFRIDAQLRHAPAIGERTVLDVAVHAERAADATAVEISLPPTLRYVTTPIGTRLDASAARLGAEAVRGVHTFLPGQTMRYVATVEAVAEGDAIVRALVRPRQGHGAVDDVAVRVGATPAQSSLHLPQEGARLVSTQEDPRAITSTATKALPPLPGTTSATSGSSAGSGEMSSPSAATTCASGRTVFKDTAQVVQPWRGVQLKAWDYDAHGPHEFLGTGWSDQNGYFTICYSDGDADDGGAADPYIKVVAENGAWRVVGDSPFMTWEIGTGVITGTGASTVNFGNVMPSDALMGVARIWDAVFRFWNWTPGDCWDDLDAVTSCLRVEVSWFPGSTKGTFYAPSDRRVYLESASADSAHVVIHEAAHSVHHDVYEANFSASNESCQVHTIWLQSSFTCAWQEGFAEWVPARVLNDPIWRDEIGGTVDLDNSTWGTAAWHNGDAVEGRVAAAMIDLSDAKNEPYWDRTAEGDMNQWQTFLRRPAQTFREFWVARQLEGYDTSNAGANGALYQNTIDLSFSDPLFDGAGFVRPNQPATQVHDYVPGKVYWSVTGARTALGNDVKLTAYERYSGTLRAMATSNALVDGVEFVAVDGNRKAVSEPVEPWVDAISGTTHTIDLSNPGTLLTDGSRTATMGTNDVVAVFDTSMAPGIPTYFRVAPSAATMNPELFLMSSAQGQPATYVRSRSQAVAKSSAFVAGLSEQFVHTSPSSQYNGLVVTNKAGSGSVTVYRDTTAPSGSVTLAGGAATTGYRSVSVTLSASDAQTGIDSFRITTDGMLDTEAWQPYKSSTTITLPDSPGTKSVLVQYRNRAHMLSPGYSDSIVLLGDTAVLAVLDPAFVATRGSRIALGDTTKNIGSVTIPSSTTRYQLVDARDAAIAYQLGTRAVPAMAPGASNAESTSFIVPTTMMPGEYVVEACSNTPRSFPEWEGDECAISTGTVTVV